MPPDPDQDTTARDADLGAAGTASGDDRADRTRAVDRLRSVGSTVGTVGGTVGATARTGARAVTTTARAGARTITGGARSGLRLLFDRVLDIAPRIPVRDLDTLQRHHGGRTGEELADALVDAAARTTSAFGAAGGVAAVRLAMRRNPFMLAVQLAAEPVAVAAVEIKLMAELHEVYDVQVTGSGVDRARYFARAWATARGVNPLDPSSAASSLGEAVKGNLGRLLAGRLGSRFVRSGPFVAGAAAGGLVNGRSTRELASAVRSELRDRSGSTVSPLP